jgi:thioredoxin-related protein
LCSILCAPAVADEVDWRADYNTARKEAAEKDRPIFLDFGFEGCKYCRLLDSTTFRDPEVIKRLNSRFVAIRIDIEKDPTLAEKLGLHMYPTVVFASPEGHILGKIEGYQEAVAFRENLERVLDMVASPEWMKRDYEAAGKAIAANDYPRAITLLKNMVHDGKDRPVQVKARQLLQDLEQQAAGRLVRARQLANRGQTTEAIDTVTELVRVFAGTQAATDGGLMLTSLVKKSDVKETPEVHETREAKEAREAEEARKDKEAREAKIAREAEEAKETLHNQQARELLAEAREDFRTQQYLLCLDRCELLARKFSDTAEGAEAARLAADIRNNPERLRQAAETASEQLGSLYLSLAENCVRKGQPQQAIQWLERVIQALPNTRQADAAQMRLIQIQGQPVTRPVDFKRP